jgi:hypothetical protein
MLLLLITIVGCVYKKKQQTHIVRKEGYNVGVVVGMSPSYINIIFLLSFGLFVVVDVMSS